MRRSTSPPDPLSIAMERGSDRRENGMFEERHGISDETPLSIAMERGRG
jgi:hypothetical protein